MAARLCLDDEQVKSLYEQGLSARDISKKLELSSHSIVLGRLREFGCVRSKNEALKLYGETHNFRRGEENPNWRGGKRNCHGYIQVYAPSHPRAVNGKYVMEHILVWEQAHNQSLPDGWVIHHLNGIRDDNRPENLLALPYRKHHNGLVNKALQERIRELETLLAGRTI